jgi:uncharacterized caspase-like protein
MNITALALVLLLSATAVQAVEIDDAFPAINKWLRANDKTVTPLSSVDVSLQEEAFFYGEYFGSPAFANKSQRRLMAESAAEMVALCNIGEIVESFMGIPATSISDDKGSSIYSSFSSSGNWGIISKALGVFELVMTEYSPDHDTSMALFRAPLQGTDGLLSLRNQGIAAHPELRNDLKVKLAPIVAGRSLSGKDNAGDVGIETFGKGTSLENDQRRSRSQACTAAFAQGVERISRRINSFELNRDTAVDTAADVKEEMNFRMSGLVPPDIKVEVTRNIMTSSKEKVNIQTEDIQLTIGSYAPLSKITVKNGLATEVLGDLIDWDSAPAQYHGITIKGIDYSQKDKICQVFLQYAHTIHDGSILPSKVDLNVASLPVITMVSPELKRGVKLTSREAGITIIGKASDVSGIAHVTINGQKAKLDAKGNFSSELVLKPGENPISVVATNNRRRSATETFILEREAENRVTPGTAAINHPMATGAYIALIIGNNDYRNLDRLKTAVSDAREVDRTLREIFGFRTKLLLNATRNDILSAFNELRKQVREQDNVLIYYAGHGEYDRTADKAFWLPVDAQPDNDTEWIIADNITASIKRLLSRHVLIVSDSCYSGTLSRSAQTHLTLGERDGFLKKMNERPSRTLMASGGNEPVADGGGSGHSIFTDSFLKALQEIDKPVFAADELFSQHVKARVAGKSEQVPQYGSIRNSGDEGGDFLFVRSGR